MFFSKITPITKLHLKHLPLWNKFTRSKTSIFNDYGNKNDYVTHILQQIWGLSLKQ